MANEPTNSSNSFFTAGRHDVFLQLVVGGEASGGPATHSRFLLFQKNVTFDQMINERARGYGEGNHVLAEVSNRKGLSLRFRQHYNTAALITRFDDASAFDPWVDEGTGEGSLIRIENGDMVWIADAQNIARSTYGLTPEQRFLGVVGSRVFYWEPAQPDQLCFFELANRNKQFAVKISPHGLWPRWRPHDFHLVLTGEHENEIWTEMSFELVRGFAQLKFSLRFERVDLNKAYDKSASGHS